MGGLQASRLTRRSALRGRSPTRSRRRTTRGSSIGISADGKRFLTIKEGSGDQTTTAQNLVVVQHFDEELKRLVPVN